MALPSIPEHVTAEIARSKPSQSSSSLSREESGDSQQTQSLELPSEASKTSVSDISSPLRVGASVEVLKDISREADLDSSASPGSSAISGERPAEERLQSPSQNADTDTSASPASSRPPAKRVRLAEDAENGLSEAEMDFLLAESSRRPKKEPSGDYLEGLSRSLLDVCLNLKDQQHPLIQKHQSEDFRFKHDGLPKVSNREDHHENLQKHLAQQLNFHVEVHNTSSEVDDSRGRATIYVWYEITGLAHGLEREAVAVLSWERKQGTWMLMKTTGMRGPAGFW